MLRGAVQLLLLVRSMWPWDNATSDLNIVKPVKLVSLVHPSTNGADFECVFSSRLQQTKLWLQNLGRKQGKCHKVKIPLGNMTIDDADLRLGIATDWEDNRLLGTYQPEAAIQWSKNDYVKSYRQQTRTALDTKSTRKSEFSWTTRFPQPTATVQVVTQSGPTNQARARHKRMSVNVQHINEEDREC